MGQLRDKEGLERGEAIRLSEESLPEEEGRGTLGPIEELLTRGRKKGSLHEIQRLPWDLPAGVKAGGG